MSNNQCSCICSCVAKYANEFQSVLDGLTNIFSTEVPEAGGNDITERIISLFQNVDTKILFTLFFILFMIVLMKMFVKPKNENNQNNQNDNRNNYNNSNSDCAH